MYLLRYIASCAFLIFTSAGLARADGFDRVELPDGKARTTTTADIQPHPRASKYYNEFWTYHVYLEGGAQLIVNFSRADIGGIREPVSGADLSLLNFDGEDYVVARQYDAEDLVYTDTDHKLRVHEDIWFKGQLPQKHQLHFETRKNSVSYYVDLSFNNIAPGNVLGNGIYRFGDEEVGLFIHIPYSEVQGTVAINGEQKQVRGTAYMDHTFMTERGPRLMDASYRYVDHQSAQDWKVGYLLDPTDKYDANLVGYGLEKSGGTVELRRAVAVQTYAESKSNGVLVPREMEVYFAKGEPLAIRQTRSRQELSAMHELGGIVKTLARKFLGGEIIMFRGEGRLNGSRPVRYNYFIVR